MMDEILQSVCLLAQDQYGNYVVQVSAMPCVFEHYSIPCTWTSFCLAELFYCAMHLGYTISCRLSY
jgi:hypothetical protein